MKKVSFIIVNYNTRDLLEKCVANLLDGYKPSEIIVVDNASNDGSADNIKERFEKKIKLIRTENNGITAGYNLGIKKATGDYYIFLGTDAFPTKEAIEKVVNFMEDEKNKNVGIATPKIVLRDGSLDMDAHRGLSTPWSSLTHFAKLDKLFPKSKLFARYFLTYKDFSMPHEIDVCISHLMCIRKETMDKLKKWDEDFWVFGEDLDICYRAQQLGYKIMYLSNIEVLHYKGAGVGRKETKDLVNASRISKESKRRLTLATTRAMKLFYKKHQEKKYPWVLNQIVYLGIFLMGKLRLFSRGMKV